MSINHNTERLGVTMKLNDEILAPWLVFVATQLMVDVRRL